MNGVRWCELPHECANVRLAKTIRSHVTSETHTHSEREKREREKESDGKIRNNKNCRRPLRMATLSWNIK